MRHLETKSFDYNLVSLLLRRKTLNLISEKDIELNLAHPCNREVEESKELCTVLFDGPQSIESLVLPRLTRKRQKYLTYVRLNDGRETFIVNNHVHDEEFFITSLKDPEKIILLETC